MNIDRELVGLQRRMEILEHVRSRGFVAVDDLAMRFKASESVVRRDLDLLANHGALLRVHGGATVHGYNEGQTMLAEEPEIELRLEWQQDQKNAIAEAAAKMVFEGQTIALDCGSTTLALAKMISHLNLNVYTSSLKIAAALRAQNAHAYLPPGQVYGSEPTLVGAQTIRFLHQLSFDYAFLGVAGLTERGIFDYSIEDCEIKQTLIDQSAKRVVLCDSSKINQTSLISICGFDDIDMVILDTAPPENIRKALLRHNVSLLSADRGFEH